MMSLHVTLAARDKEDKRPLQLISAVAFDSLHLAYAVDDGCDELLQSLGVRVPRQAVEDLGEVDARISVRHLHQQLLDDLLAEFPGLVGELACVGCLEMLERVDEAVEEHGYLDALGCSVVDGIPEAS